MSPQPSARPTKARRHWFTKYADRGVWPSIEQHNQYLEFSWGDVAVVALARYLVDIGMPAPEAFDRSKVTLKHLFPALFDAEPRWVRDPDLCQLILGRDRSGEWMTNNPDVKCPLRVIVNVDQIIFEAFMHLSDLGHEPPIDNSKAAERIAEDLMSDRQKYFIVRLRQLKDFEKDKAESLQKIMDHIQKLRAEAEAEDPDEARWMGELLETVVKE